MSGKYNIKETNYLSILKIQTPKGYYLWACFLIVGIIILNISIIFIPWQQTVIGTGRITSFSPNNRPQQIESPIKGRIKTWGVQEGDKVKQGDVIVELQDLEKDFLPTELIGLTKSSKLALIENQKAYLRKAQAIRNSINNLKDNLKDSLDSAKQSLRISETDLRTSKLNLQRVHTLANKGLFSERDKELAIQSERKAEGDYQKAQIELNKIESKILADISKLESEEAATMAEVAKMNDEIIKVDLKLSTAQIRKQISTIKAPCDGIVVRLYKRGTGETFKENEPIAIISPETTDQAAEIFIKDLDTPLVTEGQMVRLQFSGWPALQFAGLSNSIKIGTFAGKVALVDNVDSGNGKYRVLIVPAEEEKWPSPLYLRPGTQVAGWIILKTVPLGYELWRRFNGFPIGLPSIKNENKAEDKKTNYNFESDIEESKNSIIYKRKSK